MLNNVLLLSWQDILSVILGGLATAIGVSLTFLSAPLPGILSLPIIAGFAILLSSISVLLQASSVDRTVQEDQTKPQEDVIELPREIYEGQLDDSYRAGLNEGRHSGIQQSQDIIRSILEENIDETSITLTEKQISEEGLSDLQNDIEGLRSQVTTIKDQNEVLNDSFQSQFDKIEDQIESMEQEIEDIRSSTVTNFESFEKRSELEQKIEDNRQYTRTIYQIVKDNVEDFDPPSQENSDAEEMSNEIRESVEKERELE